MQRQKDQKQEEVTIIPSTHTIVNPWAKMNHQYLENAVDLPVMIEKEANLDQVEGF